jgi:hypothetical protein
MTAPTPMMIPSIARIERSLLAIRLLKATLMIIQNSMISAQQIVLAVGLVRRAA